MKRLVCCTEFSAAARFGEDAGWPPLTETDWERTRPDAHWRLIGDNDATLARLSLWWSRVADYPGARLGYVGHYAARDCEAGEHLLRQALGELKRHGATLAVGPIDGNTWERYRFISERGREPPFFFDLQHPQEWPQQFLACGFAPFSRYRSTLCEDLTALPDTVARLEARLAARPGIRLRALDMTRVDRDLDAIYRLSLMSFQDHLLYTPVSEAVFRSQYSALLRLVDPRLVLLAEHEESLAGFVFCVPDNLQRSRGEAPDTLIIKTLAVHPGARYAGLGVVLTKRAQIRAHELGYRRAIHALMHDSGQCGRMNQRRHGTKLVRRYALYAREIA
jgi:GNAT superfamily N-acetyltransferase